MNRQLHYPWCYWWLQSLPGWDPKRDCSCPAGGHLEAAGTCMESCLHRGKMTERQEKSGYQPGPSSYTEQCDILISVFHSAKMSDKTAVWIQALNVPETTTGNHLTSSYQQECCSAHSPTLGRCWCPTAQRTEDPEKSQTTYTVADWRCFWAASWET